MDSSIDTHSSSWLFIYRANIPASSGFFAVINDAHVLYSDKINPLLLLHALSLMAVVHIDYATKLELERTNMKNDPSYQ